MKKTCFVISPIGAVGSETRQNADDLLDLIIKPALEVFDFVVTRGDHRSEPNQINIDVIQSVQNADLCIADITGLNPNVMYELGRRDETLKDVIVLKARGQELPVDLGSRRCIEYDLDSRRGARDAVQQIRNFVEPMVERGFDGSSAGASLAEIALKLDRIERQIKQLTKDSKSTPQQNQNQTPGTIPKGLTPFMAFKLALQRRDVVLAESAMVRLEQEMDHLRYLDQIVELAAAIGSKTAGDKLIECAQEFMDSEYSFHDKVVYLGYMVSYINKCDKEVECLQMVEQIAEQLLAISNNESDEDIANIYNQMNRVYFGIFFSTDEEKWRLKALTALKKAIEHDPDDASYFYNYALVECKGEDEVDWKAAVDAIDKCIALQTNDEQHLSLAYRIYHALDDPRKYEILEMLRNVNAAVAEYVEANPRI